MRRLIVPIAPFIVTAALLAGCSSSDSPKTSAATSPPTSAATSAPATTSTTPSMKEQVRRSWEGIQLDVIGSKPTPGFTTLFFQHDNWAAEISWNPPNTWCLLNTYTWQVTNAQSPTRFTVRYDRIHQYAVCAPTPNDGTLIVKSVGTKQLGKRTVYNIKYTIAALKFPATRTVCSRVWNGTDQCGYKTPGVRLPTSPAT